MDNNADHEYVASDGIPSFVKNAAVLSLGDNSNVIRDMQFAGCQTVSGSGAIRLFFEFMRKWYNNHRAKVFIPDPSWPIHMKMANAAGFKYQLYRYYDRENRTIDINGLLEDLDSAPMQQIVLFHTCAHNPTGCDPTQEDWLKIFEVCERKGHFTVFDSAYQGFASGDLDKDAFSQRYFSHNLDRSAILQSFSKNFGLYGERAGSLLFVAHNEKEATVINSRVKEIVRGMYSIPPIHGAKIVDIILSNPELKASWENDLIVMSSRI